MNERIGSLESGFGETLLKMWRARVEPGKRALQRHFHPCFEITLVEQGRGRYHTSSGNELMMPGDMFVFAGNEPHYILEIESAGLQIVNLHFDPRYLLGKEQDSLSGVHMDFCFAHAKDFCNRIPASCNAGLRNEFRAILKEMTDCEPEYGLAVKSHLNLLILELLRKHHYADETGDPARRQGILEAIRYIDDRLADPLTLEEIAGIAGVTPTYFSALFKQFCNCTLWDYIVSRRIERAIGLLMGKEEHTILEIASLCGFNNTANFNKAFRKHTGVTPSEYRRNGGALLH